MEIVESQVDYQPKPPLFTVTLPDRRVPDYVPALPEHRHVYEFALSLSENGPLRDRCVYCHVERDSPPLLFLKYPLEKPRWYKPWTW